MDVGHNFCRESDRPRIWKSIPISVTSLQGNFLEHHEFYHALFFKTLTKMVGKNSCVISRLVPNRSIDLTNSAIDFISMHTIHIQIWNWTYQILFFIETKCKVDVNWIKGQTHKLRRNRREIISNGGEVWMKVFINFELTNQEKNNDVWPCVCDRCSNSSAVDRWGCMFGLGFDIEVSITWITTWLKRNRHARWFRFPCTCKGVFVSDVKPWLSLARNNVLKCVLVSLWDKVIYQKSESFFFRNFQSLNPDVIRVDLPLSVEELHENNPCLQIGSWLVFLKNLCIQEILRLKSKSVEVLYWIYWYYHFIYTTFITS